MLGTRRLLVVAVGLSLLCIPELALAEPNSPVPLLQDPTYNRQKKLGIALTGTGGGFFLATAAAWLKARSLTSSDEFESYSSNILATEDPCVTAERDGEASIESICRKQRRWNVAALSLLGAGVLTSSAGITLWVTSNHQGTKQRAVELEPVFKRGGANLRVRVRF